LDALNRSTGNKLYEIRRVPCTGNWYLTDEPIILEGCCWALESAFRKGEEAADCSSEDYFLPLDYFNISHQFLSEHCGAEEIERHPDSYAYEEHVAQLLEEPAEVRENIDESLRDILNITLAELNSIVQKRLTVADYVAQIRDFQVHKRPNHFLGFFNPIAHYQSRTIFQCPAVKEHLRESGLPLPSFYRSLPRNFEEQRQRANEWVNAATAFMSPASSFTFPAHLHLPDRKAKALLLTEGKKHWQLVSINEESYSDLQPREGYQRKAPAFQKAPIDLANEHPVYVGTQTKGEVLITPWNWAHLVYSIEDSIAILFSPRKTGG